LDASGSLNGMYFPLDFTQLSGACIKNNSCLKSIKMDDNFIVYDNGYVIITWRSWRVSFSRTGVCCRKHINAWKSRATHHSLSNKVFNLLNIGHHIKSLLKINWGKCRVVIVQYEISTGKLINLWSMIG
jgi:hypothetical protein